MKMRIGFFLSFCISSCYFGANDSGVEIMNDFYLARWDENAWISYSKDRDDIWNPQNIIIGHNVFAVGNNDDFIIAKQHPCKKKHAHFQDLSDDSTKPDRTITRYLIIDTRNDSYIIHSYNTESEFDRAKMKFEIDKKLPYKFYAKEIE